MKSAFARLLNLYPGEERNAFLFGLLAFCWSLGINLGFKYSDALLLIHVGAQALPTVYIISACGMIIPAVLFMLTVNRVASHKIFHVVIGAVICFYAFIFVCLRMGIDANWLWYTLKICSFQLDAVLITSYWTFIDQYHNMQEAKRMYVLFSLTVFCGQACTGFIMQLGIIPVQYIFLIIICFMLLSALLVKVIYSKIHMTHDQSVVEDENECASSQSIIQMMKSIFKSKFTLLVMMNNFIIFLMWVTAEYNYFTFFDNHFDPAGTAIPEGGAKDAAITIFLGKILATVSVTNLVIGLFIYSRIARRFGVTSLLFFSPVVMLVAMGGWTIHPAIIFPIMAYFVVEGFLEVIDDSNFNLLLNAIPRRLKYRVRVLIESFLEPIAMLCSGVFLSLSFVNSIYLCLTLAATAICVAVFITRKYHSAVYNNLAASAIHFERSIAEWLLLTSPSEREREIERLFQILNSDTEYAATTFAINGLLGLRDDKVTNRLLTVLKGSRPDIQNIFIDLLTEKPHVLGQDAAEQLSSWIPEISDENVENKICFFLGQLGLLHPENVIDDLNSDHLYHKATAIVTLLKTSQQLPIQVHAQNRQLANEALRTLLDSADEEELSMGIRILSTESVPAHHKRLLSYTDHPSQAIRRSAIEAFASITTPNCRQYSKALIVSLRSSDDSVFRKSCLRAIGKLDDPTLIRDIIASSLHFRQGERRLIEIIIKKMGKSSVPMLLTSLKDTSLPDRCRALSGRILGHLALSHLHANLHELMKVEIERAYFYYYHFHSIQGKYPKHDLSLLVEALETGYHSVIEFIVQLLSAAGEVEDPDLIARLFRSKDPKMRSQVVETLERTCDRKIFKTLRPLIENVPSSEILRKYLEGKRHTLELTQLLRIMSTSSSPVDRIASVTIMKQLDEPEWKDAVLNLLSSSEDIFRHFARELIES